VNTQTDQQLLRDYAGNHSESAFAELVRRHIDLVYSAARRMVCDSHQAEDVTQGVFMALAQNARQLTDHPVLSGWLHRTTQNLAANSVRTDVRRRAREQEAAAMNELLSAGSEASWEHIAPHLDAALSELSEPDRDAVVLRYFERKSAREMAQTLGISDDAAQKRVNRAVERLRGSFAKRGVTVGASGLVVVVSANAVQAAPAGLAATISTAAALAGTTLATTATATATATKAIAMTALQKTLVTATVAVLATVGIYEARQASRARGQVQALQQQQAPLAEQLTVLKAENERLSNKVAQAGDARALSQSQVSELLKLRGKATVAQTDARELERLKSALAEQTGKMPDYLTNAMAAGLSTAENWRKKDSVARLARMKQMLSLTDDQEQAARNIMMAHIERQSQRTLDLVMRRSTPEQQAQAAAGDDQEAEIKALFTPEQLAAYPGYLQAEKTLAADSSARSDASRIADDFKLSGEQQTKLHELLREMNLKEPPALSEQAKIQASTGRLAESVQTSVELQKWQLEQKLKILDGFISPEQLANYRQEQMDRINKMAAAMSMMFPPKPAETKPLP
jgi:RNA polymerase sigma factor (sigma-70 family)